MDMFGSTGIVDIFILPCRFFTTYCMCCENKQASTISESPQFFIIIISVEDLAALCSFGQLKHTYGSVEYCGVTLAHE